MRKIVVILLLLIFVLACKPTAKKEVKLESPYIGGSQGLSSEFFQLRKDVFDGGNDPFEISVKLQNLGETPVKKEHVRVRISGINPAEFGKTEDQLSTGSPDDIIEVRTGPTGTIQSPPTTVEFTNLNYKGQLAGASAQFPLRADICYLYRTEAVSKLCIRADLLNPRPGGICEVEGSKTLYSSGAPVQISSFQEQTRAKDKVGFTFEVKNAATGSVFERNSACDRTDRRKENRVYAIVNTGLSGLTCTGLESTGKGAEGFVTLYGGSKIVTCTQTIVGRTDFEQLVNMEAIYDYEQTTQTSITVKSSGEE